MNIPSKTFEFHDPVSSESVRIGIREIADAAYGLYVWPCAPVLAQYVWENRSKLNGKTVLEIGAGTALPGIVAAKCGAQVILSDNPGFKDCLQLCRENADLNNVSDVRVEGIAWGTVTPILCALPKLDIILASDCFYDSKDFADMIMTLAFLLQRDHDAEVWCSYQERSSDRTIKHLLYNWHLKADGIPTPDMECVQTSHKVHTAHDIQLFSLCLSHCGFDVEGNG